MTTISTFIDWCDDERARGYISYRKSSLQCDNTNGFLGSICKDIIKDLDHQKQKSLWNEVEYVDYRFEFPNVVCESYDTCDDIEDDQPENETQVSNTTEAEHSTNEPLTQTKEVNSECLDNLVKHQTAYV